LTEDKQKETFFKTIGGEGNETVFYEERKLEEQISEKILSCDPKNRELVYKESYDKLHQFFIAVAGSEHLYKGANTQKALLKQNLISRVIGKNRYVLEVGCGEGFLSIALSKMGNKVVGVDVSSTCIAIARKNARRFEASNVNFSRLSAANMDLPKSSFDWVISMDLIEHLHPQDAFDHLRQAAALLKPKGKYLLVTPNSRIGLHAGKAHIKEYTFEELEQLFSKAGFSVKAPFLNIISPLNVKVNLRVKTSIERIIKNRFLNLALGIDPIAVIATKRSRQQPH
jgi:2-polyprenyl-3-methyl-5-hydroxy-6-metoxy-1,4-benzoquinol methylase